MTEETTQDHGVTQAFMSAAYRAWNEALNKQEAEGGRFIDWWDYMKERPGCERLAVALGKLNQQVENGGFSQWHDNGYSDAADAVDQYLRGIGEPACLKVAALTRRAVQALRDDESGLRELDDAFYKVNTAMLDEVESYLSVMRNN